MKKVFTFLFLFMLNAALFAQGTWTQRADLGAVRDLAVGFSIGSRGYVGTGVDNGSNFYYQDFWEYNPSSNAWTQKANFGGGLRAGAVGFCIGAKGYIGTGSDISGDKQDFWEYNPISNTWIQKSNFGGSARIQAVGFSIGANGYIGTGYNGVMLKDFWQYDPLNNTWIQKSDFGGVARNFAVGFSIGGSGFIGSGGGNNSATTYSDFWKYDTLTDTWTQKANFGGTARRGATGFSIGSKGYIGLGEPSLNDFWEYNSLNDTWSQKANFEGSGRCFAVGFAIGSDGYIGTGLSGIASYKDFWKYYPCSITPSICMVTVDSLSKNNVILWDKISYQNADSFIVYREVGLNDYQRIAAIPYDSLSLFVDTVRTKYFPNTGSPNLGTYKYKLQIRDSCGGLSQFSEDHNTIFITNNSGTFSWPQLYLIGGTNNPVSNYILMRDNLNNGNWIVVNSVAGSQQTITDPQYATFQSTAAWRVETQWSISCAPSKISPEILSFNSSRSNIFSFTTGINEYYNNPAVSIYPNPTEGEFTVYSRQSAINSMEIYDVFGEVVFQTTVNSKQHTVNPMLSSGIYFYKLALEGTIVATGKLIIKQK